MQDGYDPDLDFKAEADKMLLAARFAADLRLEAIIATIDAAHSVGPFIDPTKYRDALARGHLDRLEALAKALEPVAKLFREEWADHVLVEEVPA